MTTTTTPTARVEDFVQALAACPIPFRVAIRQFNGNRSVVVEVEADFTPGDSAAYIHIEAEANHLLRRCHVTQPGSRWGSDSGSVGGHAALTSGHFHLCQSGVGLLFASKLAKRLGLAIYHR